MEVLIAVAGLVVDIRIEMVEVEDIQDNDATIKVEDTTSVEMKVTGHDEMIKAVAMVSEEIMMVIAKVDIDQEEIPVIIAKVDIDQEEIVTITEMVILRITETLITIGMTKMEIKDPEGLELILIISFS